MISLVILVIHPSLEEPEARGNVMRLALTDIAGGGNIYEELRGIPALRRLPYRRYCTWSLLQLVRSWTSNDRSALHQLCSVLSRQASEGELNMLIRLSSGLEDTGGMITMVVQDEWGFGDSR